jgi:hypothetical protein
MSLSDITGMLSGRTGIQQSVSSSIMSTIMNYMIQRMMNRGIDSFMNSGGSKILEYRIQVKPSCIHNML